MDQEPKIKQSHIIAHKALRLLEIQGVPATPENYIIFYIYLSGENKGLTEMVRKHFEACLPWTQETTAKVFKLLFSPGSNMEFFHCREAISRELREMADGIVQETRSTADLADKSSRVIKNKLDIVDRNPCLGQVKLDEVITELRSLSELSDRLGGSLRLKTGRLQEFAEKLTQMERIALTDELTQLANRRAWNTVLGEAFEKFKSDHKPLVLLIADLDDFKVINDTYGHSVGDEALRAVARIMIAGLRGEDFPARFGGEEFVALMPATDLAGGARVAERLRRAIADTKFTVRGNAITITASFGLAAFNPNDSGTEQILNRADQALYLAKSRGKNQICSEKDLSAAVAC